VKRGNVSKKDTHLLGLFSSAYKTRSFPPYPEPFSFDFAWFSYPSPHLSGDEFIGKKALPNPSKGKGSGKALEYPYQVFFTFLLDCKRTRTLDLFFKVAIFQWHSYF